MQAAAGQDSSIPGLSASEAEGHARAVADVLNSVLASQIQVVDAEKEEEELKHASAHSSDADPGMHRPMESECRFIRSMYNGQCLLQQRVFCRDGLL